MTLSDALRHIIDALGGDSALASDNTAELAEAIAKAIEDNKAKAEKPAAKAKKKKED